MSNYPPFNELSDIEGELKDNYEEMRLHITKLVADAAELITLANSVKTDPYEIYCEDIGEVNWFDKRDELINKHTRAV